jgi:hypothetical protein
VALSVTATHPASPSAQFNAVLFQVTGNGSASQTNVAVQTTYSAGYTGSSLTAAGQFANANAGTGATLIPAAGSNTFVGNAGSASNANATTTGTNSGAVGRAANGNVNSGVTGLAQVAKNGAANIGVMGSGINTGTSPVHAGVYAHLNQTTALNASAALVADNGAQSDPVARFRVAGIDKVTVDGSGNLNALAAFSATGAATFSNSVATAQGSVAVANGLNSNVATPASSYVRLTGPSAGFSIGGLTAGVNGYRLTIYNTVAQTMTIVNEDASSTAGNRIKTLTGANVVLRAGTSSAQFVYDSSDSRWVLIATN